METRPVLLLSVAVLCGAVGCAGVSVEQIDSYCIKYPDDANFCLGARFGVEQAEIKARTESDLPPDAYLIEIDSDSNGKVAPDGLAAADSQWRLVYLTPAGEAFDYDIFADRLIRRVNLAETECTAADAIAATTLAKNVREATSLLESNEGVRYSPGDFSINVIRQASCISSSGFERMLVHSQSRSDNDRRKFTVQFDSNHPTGITCALNLNGCVE